MKRKPNIILITIDCLRADCCDWINREKEGLTPFLNKIASESFVFARNFATGPTTSFSFPGILTGTYPLSFKDWDRKKFPGIDQRPSLPGSLSANNYLTIAVNDHPYLSAFFGYDYGFDIFKSYTAFHQIDHKKSFLEIFIGGFYRMIGASQKLIRSKNFICRKIFAPFYSMVCKFFPAFLYMFMTIAGGLKKFPFIPATAQMINEKIFKEINFPRDPWFMWVHYNDLHEPYFQSENFIYSDLSKINLEKISLKYLLQYNSFKRGELELLKEMYCVNLKHLDQKIEQFFRSMGEKLEGAIIIITSDHGQQFGENGRIGHDNILDKELLHVPLVVKIPGKKGKIIDKITSSSQIPATILELVNIIPPSGMEQSLFKKDRNRTYSECLTAYDNASFYYFDLNTKQRIEIKDDYL